MAVLLDRRLLDRALVAAVLSAVLFALKAATIAVGRDPFDDPWVNGFFYAGALALAVSFALAGSVLARRRGRPSRLTAAALGLVAGVLGAVLVAVVATAVVPADGGWVWGEVNLWVIAVVTLVVLLVLRARTVAPRRAV